MGGTSERKPPGRDRAHRHLHAVPSPDQGGETGSAPGAGPGGESTATPEPFPEPPPGSAADAVSNGDAPPPAQPAAGASQAANGTSAPETSTPAAPSGQSAMPSGLPAAPSGPPATPSGTAGTPSRLWTPARRRVLAVIGLYAVLLIFGVLLGLTGSFQFSRGVGPVPVAAVCFAVAIGAACLLCGRATRSVAGALVPAVGWIVASFSMAMPNTSGSVVITNSLAGEIYLYGGALCAAIGVGAAFGGWTRAQQAGRSARSTGPRRPRP